MNNRKDLCIIFILLAMCQRALCSDNGGCERDVLRIKRHSFDKIYTKQSFDINGLTFYISKEEDTIWWNDASDSWDFHQFVNNSAGTWLNLVSLKCDRTKKIFKTILLQGFGKYSSQRFGPSLDRPGRSWQY